MATQAPRHPVPPGALAHHLALLGKTGSGKTSTAKVLVEEFFAAGERVCILDPIKSDWWGLTSNAAGDGPGLPFVILGGPRGHTPLESRAGALVGQLEADGRLRHVIVDMADFEPGGAPRFFIDFASTLLRQMRGAVHLVMEEAHEFAPKERAGIGNENLSVHWAKKLATAGRSKGIRLLMATQATQSLHNGLLGSCETMIAHRLTLPAQQKPVLDWLKANVGADLALEIAESLSSLQTGEAWVCSGEARFFRRVTFPPIATFDNSATPTGELASAEVRTAPVDVGALLELLKPEAPAPDPKASAPAVAPTSGQLEAARQAAYDEGYRLGFSEGTRIEWRRHMEASHADHMARLAEIQEQLGNDAAAARRPAQIEARAHEIRAPEPIAPRAQEPRRASRANPALPEAPEGFTSGQRMAGLKLLSAIARYPDRGLTWEEACVVAGMRGGNGYFYGGRKYLLGLEFVAEVHGKIGATDAGRTQVDAGEPLTRTEFVALWSGLKQPAPRMLKMLADAVGLWVEKERIAEALSIKPGNGFWYGGLSAMRDAGLTEEEPSRVRVIALIGDAAL